MTIPSALWWYIHSPALQLLLSLSLLLGARERTCWDLPSSYSVNNCNMKKTKNPHAEEESPQSTLVYPLTLTFCRLHPGLPPSSPCCLVQGSSAAAVTNLEGASDLCAFPASCSRSVVYHTRLMLGSTSSEQHVKPGSYHHLATPGRSGPVKGS